MSDDSGNGGRTGWLERIARRLGGGEPEDAAQLLELLRAAEGRGVIEGDALAMIEGVLQVTEMQVRDIMIPRSQMVVVGRDDDHASYLPQVTESAHSRFPVIGESRDEIHGILLAKDLLAYFAQGGEGAFDLREVVRPAVFIPESKRLHVLLREFRTNRNHMAIVVDEYGGVAGLVTIEDVLEQIVGEIEDEHDIDADIFILHHTDDRYTVKALTPIEEFNDQFGTSFSDDEFDTVGGLVMQAFGYLPRRGEAVDLAGWRFEVLRADKRRLHLLQVTVAPEEPAAEEEGHG